jgi:hypothetical protein
MYRSEHPKPQFMRENWVNLNGPWQFEFDFGNSGVARELYKNDKAYSKTIEVPFCPESKLSGIEYKDFMNAVWYRREIEITKEQLKNNVILHFGAADYITTVYVNEKEVGVHKGGSVSFKFDITDYVNKLILGEEKNYGLGMCFSPVTETLKMKHQQYVGFFTCHTNTFFHPYLETIDENVIVDDRDNFTIGKTNRLYLYCFDGNEYYNLDEIPTCTIEGFEDKKIEVKQQGKGVYYAEISFKKGEIEPNTILYEKWQNLALNGEILEDEEFEFVVLPPKSMFNTQNASEEYIPSTSGIYDNERLNIGEVRKVEVTFRKQYTTNQYKVLKNCFYRVYVKEANKEIDVFPWHPVEKRFLTNRFYINTNDLIPNKYYVDIKTPNRTYKNVCEFQVVSNITQRYM